MLPGLIIKLRLALFLVPILWFSDLRAQQAPQVSVMRGPAVSPLAFDHEDKECRSLAQKAAPDQSSATYAGCMKHYGNIVKMWGAESAAAMAPSNPQPSVQTSQAAPGAAQQSSPAIQAAEAPASSSSQSSGTYAPGFSDDAYTPAHWVDNGRCATLTTMEIEPHMDTCVTTIARQMEAEENMLSGGGHEAELVSLLTREAAIGLSHGAEELCKPARSSAGRCEAARAMAAISVPRFEAEALRQEEADMTPVQRAQREQVAVEERAAKQAADQAAEEKQRWRAERRAAVAKNPNQVTLFNVTIGERVDLDLDPCYAPSKDSSGFGGLLDLYKYNMSNLPDAGAFKTLKEGMAGPSNEGCILAPPGAIAGIGLGIKVLFTKQQKEDFPWLLAAVWDRELSQGAQPGSGDSEQSSGSSGQIDIRTVDGRVQQLSFLTGGKAYEEEILDALKEKFGNSPSRRMETYRNEAGASWQNPVYLWRKGGVTVTFEYEPFLTNPAGIVIVQSDTSAQDPAASQKPRAKL